MINIDRSSPEIFISSRNFLYANFICVFTVFSEISIRDAISRYFKPSTQLIMKICRHFSVNGQSHPIASVRIFLDRFHLLPIECLFFGMEDLLFITMLDLLMLPVVNTSIPDRRLQISIHGSRDTESAPDYSKNRQMYLE